MVYHSEVVVVVVGNGRWEMGPARATHPQNFFFFEREQKF